MKTIEERAELNLMYEKDFCGHSLSDDMVCRAYVRGAKEQKAIDDAECVNQVLMGNRSAINYYKQGYHDASEKFCEWLRSNWRKYVYRDRDGGILFGHWESDFRKAMEKEPCQR